MINLIGMTYRIGKSSTIFENVINSRNVIPRFILDFQVWPM